MEYSVDRVTPVHMASAVPGVALVICLFGLIAAKFILPALPIVQTTVYVAIFFVLVVVSFARPLWGVLIIVAFLPIERLLPAVSFSTSMYPVLGGSAFLGYIVQEIVRKGKRPVIEPAHIAAILFLIWIAASNPQAAFTMTTRVWFFTLIQLTVFMFVVSQLVRNVEDFRMIAAGFVFTAVISAAFAIPQVQLGIDSSSSLRAVGLGSGPNGAARMYVVAVLLASYFFLTSSDSFRRILLLTGVAILLHGLAATVSRTGILLFLFALGIASVAPSRREYGSWFIPILATFFGTLALLPTGYWKIVSGIFSSVVDGTDSVGFRYMQWHAALDMFRDNIIAGVGIGQFTTQVHYYGTGFVPFYGIGYVAHSLPLGLLAETGIIGLVLFSTIALFTMHRLIAAALQDTNLRGAPSYFLAAAMGLTLLGGSTADTQFEKLFWCLMGIANGFVFHSPRSADAVRSPAYLKSLTTRFATAVARLSQ